MADLRIDQGRGGALGRAAVSEESGEETVRIISARKATPRERRTYEQNQKKGS